MLRQMPVARFKGQGLGLACLQVWVSTVLRLASCLGKAGEATKGVMNCFLAWLETRGGEQSTEEIRALAQVRAFFEKHTAARFTSLDGCSDGINYESTVNRAGYKRYTNEHDRVEYWVLPEVFKQDICAGFDYRFVAKLLRDKGVLVPDGEGKNTTTKRINSLHESIRVFVITAKIFSQG